MSALPTAIAGSLSPRALPNCSASHASCVGFGSMLVSSMITRTGRRCRGSAPPHKSWTITRTGPAGPAERSE